MIVDKGSRLENHRSRHFPTTNSHAGKVVSHPEVRQLVDVIAVEDVAAVKCAGATIIIRIEGVAGRIQVVGGDVDLM